MANTTLVTSLSGPEISANPPQDASVIYNTDISKFQFYQGGLIYNLPVFPNGDQGDGAGSVVVVDNLGNPSAVGKLVDNTSENYIGNLGLGINVFQNATTGAGNVAMGFRALSSLTTGSNNIAMGYHALRNVQTCNSNIGIGASVMDNNNSTGTGNIGIGVAQLLALTSGSYNTVIGTNGGNGNQVVFAAGSGNVAIGTQGMGVNSADTNNAILIGTNTNAGGDTGIAIGFNATTNNTNGIAIGTSSHALGVNAIAIGTNATASNDHTMAIGDVAGTSDALQVMIGAQTPVAGALLTLSSTTFGLAFPSLSTAQRTTLGALPPAGGVMVYDNQLGKMAYWDGVTAAWVLF